MSDQTSQLLVALIASFPGILVAIGTLVVALRTRTVVNEVKVATDGMSTALVAATGKAEHGAGMVQGALEERARNRTDVRDAASAAAAAALSSAAAPQPVAVVNVPEVVIKKNAGDT